jgi:hypothetical protein
MLYPIASETALFSDFAPDAFSSREPASTPDQVPGAGFRWKTLFWRRIGAGLVWVWATRAGRTDLNSVFTGWWV